MVINNSSVIYTIKHDKMSNIKKSRKQFYTMFLWLLVLLMALKGQFIKITSPFLVDQNNL
jgi:ABC-type microcin C transport system permease subunit YejE